MGFCLIRCEVSINSVHDWRHLIGSKYQRAFAVTCEICLMFALSCITRINLKRHRVCPEIARSNVYFQLEASLIVKCMAWPLCRGENEWPGGRFLGRHSKHVLRNADLSFTSFTLRPPPLRTSELPFYFRENPTCLLHLQGRSRNTLRRQSMYDVKECLSAEWRVPFNFLPVRSFWVEPQGDVKELQRLEGPHSSGPLCSRGPSRGLVSQVAVHQSTRHSKRWVNTSETLFTSTFTKPHCFPSFVVKNLETLATRKTVEREHFSRAYPSSSFSFITLSKHNLMGARNINNVVVSSLSEPLSNEGWLPTLLFSANICMHVQTHDLFSHY